MRKKPVRIRRLAILLFLMTLLLVVYAVTARRAFAHRPVIVKTGNSEERPVTVVEPEISWAYYGMLAGEPHYYEIKSDEAFNLYVNIPVPDFQPEGELIPNHDMSFRVLSGGELLYEGVGRAQEWIRESTTIYPVENPGGDPYGYLWRISPQESDFGYGFYHGGLGVHLLAVLPDQKLVLVHRVDTDRDFDITWSEIRTLMQMIFSARMEPE